MIFALLFFFAFVVGLVLFVLSERWWLGGVICTLLLLALAYKGFTDASLQGVAVYFGVPIVFLGSLFGAYIVQLRRGIEEDGDTVDSEDKAP